MTTITWINTASGIKKIEIYKSRDKLISTLKSCSKLKEKDTDKIEYYLTIKDGRKNVKYKLHSVTYEDEDEIAIFRRFQIIPQESDYYDK